MNWDMHNTKHANILRPKYSYFMPLSCRQISSKKKFPCSWNLSPSSLQLFKIFFFFLIRNKLCWNMIKENTEKTRCTGSTQRGFFWIAWNGFLYVWSESQKHTNHNPLPLSYQILLPFYFLFLISQLLIIFMLRM